MRTYDRLAVEQEGSVSLRHLHGVVNPLMQLVQAVARHRRACHEQVGPPKVSALDVAHDALQRAPEEGVAGRGGHEADLHRRPVAQPQFHRGFRSSRRNARAYAAGCRSQPPLPLAPVGAEVAYLRSTHTSGTRRPLALVYFPHLPWTSHWTPLGCQAAMWLPPTRRIASRPPSYRQVTVTE